jgi:transposase
MVDLVRSGRKPEDLEKEFEPSGVTIRAWVKAANGDRPYKSFQTVAQTEVIDEKKELEQLRRENRILREERDLLKKAAAWFAQETGVPSSRRSSS